MGNSIKHILSMNQGGTASWNNSNNADIALKAMRDFYLNNSTETIKTGFIGCRTVNLRKWNDPTAESDFITMFEDLGDFLLSQPSDELTMATLITAIRRYEFSIAIEILSTKCWSPLVKRLWPLMK